ncbi:MAG: DUF4340 domain-containing protein [Chloroflexi bacterium]|nr:DUF4340 domain-containing protein [Chloroflexota bacterium]
MSIRITFVLVMFLAVVAGYFFFYDPAARKPEEPVTPWFYTTNMEDINRIQVEHEGKTTAYFRDESKAWRFADEFEMPVDLTRWGGVTLLLSGPRSRRSLSATIDDPAKYALDKPKTTIDVTLTGERQVRAYLGSKTPDGLYYYVTQEGNPGLFIIDGGWGDIMTNLAKELPYPEWFYKLDPKLLIFLGITHGTSQTRFVFDGEEWRIATKEETALDAKRWEEVQPLLGGPPSLRPLAKSIDAPEQYGLKEPATIIQVDYQPPFPPSEEDPEPELRRSFKLFLGNLLPDASGYYAQVEGQPFLLFVDRAWSEVMVRLATSPPIVQQESQAEKATSPS